MKNNWKKIWNSPPRLRKMIAGTLLMLVLVSIMPVFFNHIEKRQGTQLNDWVLAQSPPHNVSIAIFAVIWGMILLATIRAIYNPSIYISYCWTLILVCIARLTCISLVPLAPPIGLIPLTDPLTSVFYGNAVITKDLFFSGHVATLTLIYLCLQKKTDKTIALIATIVVAFLLLVQHIHYTIDIVAAPVFVYTFYRVTNYFLYGMTKPRTVSKVYAENEQ